MRLAILSLLSLTLTLHAAQSSRTVTYDPTSLQLVAPSGLWSSNRAAIAAAVAPILGTNSGSSGSGTATSVITFGADKTGTSDSTAAFEAAQIASATNGYEVFVPPGTYKLNLVLRSRVHLKGAGGTVRYDWTDEVSNATKLRANDPTKPIILIGQYSGCPQFPMMGQRLSDLGFDGQGSATIGLCISNHFSGQSQYAGNGMIVEGCAFQRFTKYGVLDIGGGSLDMRQNCLMNSPTNFAALPAVSGDLPDAGSLRNNVIGGSRILQTTNGCNIDIQGGMGWTYDGGDIGNNRLHLAVASCTFTIVSGNFETCYGTHFIENYNAQLTILNTQFRHTQAGANTSAAFIRHTSGNGRDMLLMPSIYNVSSPWGAGTGWPAWEGVSTATAPIILTTYGSECSYRFTADGFSTFSGTMTVRTPHFAYESASTIAGKVPVFDANGNLWPSNAPSSGVTGLPWTALSNNATPTVVVTNSRLGVGVSAPTALADFKGSSSGRVTIGTMDGAPEYGTISLNGGGGSMSAAAYNLASSPDDKTLYINVPSGQSFRFTVNGTTMLLLSGSGDATFSGGIMYGGKWLYWRTNTISGTEIRYLGDGF